MIVGGVEGKKRYIILKSLHRAGSAAEESKKNVWGVHISRLNSREESVTIFAHLMWSEKGRDAKKIL